jgi:hypothetical protein
MRNACRPGIVILFSAPVTLFCSVIRVCKSANKRILNSPVLQDWQPDFNLEVMALKKLTSLTA